jgi:hypothetical protein
VSADVDIVNLGLVRLRQKQLLAALDTTTATGRSALRVYANSRDLLLESYAWGFATSIEQLAVIGGDPPPGWAYGYTIPNECLYVRVVCDENGARYYARNPYAYYDQALTSAPYAVPYQILRVGGEPVIVTDMSLAYAVCTMQVDNPEHFTASFSDALSWAVAADLGPSLGADDRIVDNAQKWAVATAAYAKAQSGNQRQQDRPPESPTVACRD